MRGCFLLLLFFVAVLKGPVQAADDVIVIEAEAYALQTPGEATAADVRWETVSDEGSVAAYVAALPNTGVNTGDSLTGARLDYPVSLPQTGTWYVWIRTRGDGGTNDSLHLGLNGQAHTFGKFGMGDSSRQWHREQHVRNRPGSDRVELHVDVAGPVTLNVWVREDGTQLDRILLTQDPNFIPQASGPITPFSGELPAVPRGAVSGLLSIEAEHADVQHPGSTVAANHTWQASSQIPNFSGQHALVAAPNAGVNVADTLRGPRLDYAVQLDVPGTWYVWVRMAGAGGTNDSLHVGLNGSPLSYGRLGVTDNQGTFQWVDRVKGRRGPDRLSVTVVEPGAYLLNLWMREDGTHADKIVLTTDPHYIPQGIGPDESARVSLPPIHAGPFQAVYKLLDPAKGDPATVARNGRKETVQVQSGNNQAGLIDIDVWQGSTQLGTRDWASVSLFGQANVNYWIGMADWKLSEQAEFDGSWVEYTKIQQDTHLRLAYLATDASAFDLQHGQRIGLTGALPYDAIVVELAFLNVSGGPTAWQTQYYGGNPLQVGVWQVPAGQSLGQAQQNIANRLNPLSVLTEVSARDAVRAKLQVQAGGHWQVQVDLDGDGVVDWAQISSENGNQQSALTEVTEASGLVVTVGPASGAQPGRVGQTDVVLAYQEHASALVSATDRRPLLVEAPAESFVSPMLVSGKRWDDSYVVTGVADAGAVSVRAVGARAFVAEVPLQKDHISSWTLRQSGSPLTEITRSTQWVPLELHTDGRIHIRSGDSVLLSYPNAYTEAASIFIDDGRGGPLQATAPGETVTATYTEPGLYLARAYVAHETDELHYQEIGTYTIYVGDVELPQRIIAGIGYQQTFIVDAGQRPWTSFAIKAEDPSLLAVDILEVTGSTALVGVTPLGRGRPVVQLRDRDSGAVFAAVEVEEFTITSTAQESLLVNDATSRGTSVFTMQPYIPGVRVDALMFAGRASFPGGRQDLQITFDESAQFSLVDGEIIAQTEIEIIVPPGEDKYCYRSVAVVETSTGTTQVVGNRGSTNGCVCRVRVDKVELCEGDIVPLPISIISSCGSAAYDVGSTSGSTDDSPPFVDGYAHCGTGQAVAEVDASNFEIEAVDEEGNPVSPGLYTVCINHTLFEDVICVLQEEVACEVVVEPLEFDEICPGTITEIAYTITNTSKRTANFHYDIQMRSAAVNALLRNAQGTVAIGPGEQQRVIAECVVDEQSEAGAIDHFIEVAHADGFCEAEGPALAVVCPIEITSVSKPDAACPEEKVSFTATLTNPLPHTCHDVVLFTNPFTKAIERRPVSVPPAGTTESFTITVPKDTKGGIHTAQVSLECGNSSLSQTVDVHPVSCDLSAMPAKFTHIRGTAQTYSGTATLKNTGMCEETFTIRLYDGNKIEAAHKRTLGPGKSANIGFKIPATAADDKDKTYQIKAFARGDEQGGCSTDVVVELKDPDPSTPPCECIQEPVVTVASRAPAKQTICVGESAKIWAALSVTNGLLRCPIQGDMVTIPTVVYAVQRAETGELFELSGDDPISQSNPYLLRLTEPGEHQIDLIVTYTAPGCINSGRLSIPFTITVEAPTPAIEPGLTTLEFAGANEACIGEAVTLRSAAAPQAGLYTCGEHQWPVEVGYIEARRITAPDGAGKGVPVVANNAFHFAHAGQWVVEFLYTPYIANADAIPFVVEPPAPLLHRFVVNVIDCEPRLTKLTVGAQGTTCTVMAPSVIGNRGAHALIVPVNEMGFAELQIALEGQNGQRDKADQEILWQINDQIGGINDTTAAVRLPHGEETARFTLYAGIDRNEDDRLNGPPRDERSLSVDIILIRADLDIDSDNSGPWAVSDDSLAEEELEADQVHGKLIWLNTNGDKHGVPGFARGWKGTIHNDEGDLIEHNAFAPDPAARFVPLSVRLPALDNLRNVHVSLDYDLADPAQVIRSEDPISGRARYSAGADGIRIWTVSAWELWAALSKDAAEAEVLRLNASRDNITRVGWLIQPGEALPRIHSGRTIQSTDTLWIEAVRPGTSGDITLTVSAETADGCALVIRDTVSWHAGQLDLDIDSDNALGLHQEDPTDDDGVRLPRGPDHSDEEEFIEEDAGRLNKAILVNNGYTDIDATPDYLDGFDLSEGSDNNAEDPGSAPFVPVVVRIPSRYLDSEHNASLVFTYDELHPDPSKAALQPGEIRAQTARLWRKDGGAFREVATNFIAPGEEQALDSFSWVESEHIGYHHEVTLYLEATNPAVYHVNRLLDPDFLHVQLQHGNARADVMQDQVLFRPITVTGNAAEVTQLQTQRLQVVDITGLHEELQPQLLAENSFTYPYGPVYALSDEAEINNILQSAEPIPDNGVVTFIGASFPETAFFSFIGQVVYPMGISLSALSDQQGGAVQMALILHKHDTIIRPIAVDEQRWQAVQRGWRTPKDSWYWRGPGFAPAPLGSDSLLGNIGYIDLNDGISNLITPHIEWEMVHPTSLATSKRVTLFTDKIQHNANITNIPVGGRAVGAALLQGYLQNSDQRYELISIPVVVDPIEVHEPQMHQMEASIENMALRGISARDLVEFDPVYAPKLTETHLVPINPHTVTAKDLLRQQWRGVLYRLGQILPPASAANGTDPRAKSILEPFIASGSHVRFVSDTQENLATETSLRLAIDLAYLVEEEGALRAPTGSNDGPETAARLARLMHKFGGPQYDVWRRYRKVLKQPHHVTPILRESSDLTDPEFAMIDQAHMFEERARVLMIQAALLGMKHSFALDENPGDPDIWHEVSRPEWLSEQGFVASLQEDVAFSDTGVYRRFFMDNYGPAVIRHPAAWFSSANTDLEGLFDDVLASQWRLGNPLTEDVLNFIITQRAQMLAKYAYELDRLRTNSDVWPFWLKNFYLHDHSRDNEQDQRIEAEPARLVFSNLEGGDFRLVPEGQGSFTPILENEPFAGFDIIANGYAGSQVYEKHSGRAGTTIYALGIELFTDDRFPYELSPASIPQREAHLYGMLVLATMQELHTLQRLLYQVREASTVQENWLNAPWEMAYYSMGDLIFGLKSFQALAWGEDFETGKFFSFEERVMHGFMAAVALVDIGIPSVAIAKGLVTTGKNVVSTVNKSLRDNFHAVLDKAKKAKEADKDSVPLDQVQVQQAEAFVNKLDTENALSLSKQEHAATGAELQHLGDHLETILPTGSKLENAELFSIELDRKPYGKHSGAYAGSGPNTTRPGYRAENPDLHPSRGSAPTSKSEAKRVADGDVKVFQSDEAFMDETRRKLFEEGGQELVDEFDLVACFVADTPVKMGDGSWKAIQNIRVGDTVMARDDENPHGVIQPHKVVATILKTSAKTHVVSVKRAGGSLQQPIVVETTAEHPFWSMDANGWLSAEDLSAGTIVRGLEHNWTVTAHEVINEAKTVYNLTVEGAHTYFVGDVNAIEQGYNPAVSAVWVHNTCNWTDFVPRFGGDVNSNDFKQAIADTLGKSVGDVSPADWTEALNRYNKAISDGVPGLPGTVRQKVTSVTDPDGGDTVSLLRLNMRRAIGKGPPGFPNAAHHMIPDELADHALLKIIGFDMDDFSNGIYLRSEKGLVPYFLVHNGSHPAYTQVVGERLTQILNKHGLTATASDAALSAARQDIRSLRRNIRRVLNRGRVPLHAPNSDDATAALLPFWRSALQQI